MRGAATISAHNRAALKFAEDYEPILANAIYKDKKTGMCIPIMINRIDKKTANGKA